MKIKLTFSIFSSLICFLLSAQSLIPHSFIDIKPSSSLIIEGKIIKKESFFDEEKNAIFTRNFVDVTNVITSQRRLNRVVILTEGGNLEDISQDIPHAPNLQVNDRGIFFLKIIDEESSLITEIIDGKFGIYSFLENDKYYEIYNRGTLKKHGNAVKVINNIKSIIDKIEFKTPHGVCLSFGEVYPDLANNKVSVDVMIRSEQAGAVFSSISLEIDYPVQNFGINIVGNNKLDVLKRDVVMSPSYTLSFSDASHGVFDVDVESACTFPPDFNFQNGLYTLSDDYEKLFRLELTMNSLEELGNLNMESFALTGSSERYDELLNDCVAFEQLCVENGETELEVCSIHSVSTAPFAAGIKQYMTIEGDGFETVGAIAFPNADNDGATTMTISSTDIRYIKSWTDTKIEVLLSSILHGHPVGSGDIIVQPINTEQCKRLVDIEYAIMNIYDSPEERMYSIAENPMVRNSFEWYIDKTAFDNDPNFDFNDVEEVAKQAFCDWENATDLEFEYMGDNTGGANGFDNKHTITLEALDQSVLAETTRTKSSNLCGLNDDPYINGILRDSDIKFNSAKLFDITMNNNINGSMSDFYSVLLHEIGHAIMLNHAMDPLDNGSNDDRIMYWGLEVGQVKRSLDQASVNGIDLQIERTEEAITGCLSGFVLDVDPMGCGTNHVHNANVYNGEIKVSNLINSTDLIEITSVNNPISYVFLYDASGNLIKKWNNINSLEFKSEPSNLVYGVYFAKVGFENSFVTKKIVVAN